MILNLVTAPASEPISLEEAKSHLHIDSNSEDTYIATLIAAARAFAEKYTGRAFVSRALRYEVKEFPTRRDYCDPAALYLPIAPVISVESIRYINTDGDEITLDEETYSLIQDDEDPYIVPAHEVEWPTDLRDQVNAVKIEFKAGYSYNEDSSPPEEVTANVPPDIKTALKLLLTDWHNNRANVVVGTITATLPIAVTAMLWNYKRKGF
ncbi:MAG: head-tail connector protein [Alphaproteobacteria bacterium]